YRGVRHIEVAFFIQRQRAGAAKGGLFGIAAVARVALLADSGENRDGAVERYLEYAKVIHIGEVKATRRIAREALGGAKRHGSSRGAVAEVRGSRQRRDCKGLAVDGWAQEERQGDNGRFHFELR